jgi:hypothetical protein
MTPRTDTRSETMNSNFSKLLCTALAVASACVLVLTAGATEQSTATTAAGIRTFATAQQAADVLIDAAEKFDVPVLEQIFGSAGRDIVLTGEPVYDREVAAAFAAQAREKKSVVVDPQNPNRALLSIGNEDWPFPVPIVRKSGKWSFDSAAGRRELLYRRIGRNELDAIEMCHGYVEAQHEYALRKRGESGPNQYAQRIISTRGKQDGLAWQNPDGTWGGPVGEKIAQVIEQGYTSRAEPYHGYFFKVLKGQGPAAPLGEMDFVVKGLMIGGFALVAAPAEYGITGLKTFVVSHDGVVYEKDCGPQTLDVFKSMELYNPDKTWDPVKEQ